MNLIKEYIQANPRHKLVFCCNQIADFEYVDMGYEMGVALKDKLNYKRLPMMAADILQGIIDSNQHIHPEYGRYTAIKNLGILFEPQLKIDIRSILERNSKDQLLVIQNKDLPSSDTFRLRSYDNEHICSLNGLGFIKINII